MRDAFGGAFMIKLLIVFIIIYVGFTAVALNYAKAFKAKNLVIEYLEQNEISDLGSMPASEDSEMFDYFNKEIVGNVGYIYKVDECSPKTDEFRCYPFGVMIEQVVPNENQKNKLGVYYRVTTYFGFQLPFFDRLFAISGRSTTDNIVGRWVVRGETRPIAYE